MLTKPHSALDRSQTLRKGVFWWLLNWQLTCCDQSWEDPALSVLHVILGFPEFFKYVNASSPASRFGAICVGLTPSPQQKASIFVVKIDL